MKRYYCLVIFLLLIFSCKNYSTKTIDNEKYVHVFNNVYYKVNPVIIDNYYSSRIKDFQWTKFNYKIYNFAMIHVYLTTEQLSDELLQKINTNKKEEIINYFTVNTNNITFENPDIFLNTENEKVITVTHSSPTKTILPAKKGWKNGHIISETGASTDITIMFLDESSIINYEITIEYLPPLDTSDDAQLHYETNKMENIIPLINKLKF